MQALDEAGSRRLGIRADAAEGLDRTDPHVAVHILKRGRQGRHGRLGPGADLPQGNGRRGATTANPCREEFRRCAGTASFAGGPI